MSPKRQRFLKPASIDVIVKDSDLDTINFAVAENYVHGSVIDLITDKGVAGFTIQLRYLKCTPKSRHNLISSLGYFTPYFTAQFLGYIIDYSFRNFHRLLSHSLDISEITNISTFSTWTYLVLNDQSGFKGFRQ